MCNLQLWNIMPSCLNALTFRTHVLYRFYVYNEFRIITSCITVAHFHPKLFTGRAGAYPSGVLTYYDPELLKAVIFYSKRPGIVLTTLHFLPNL